MSSSATPIDYARRIHEFTVRKGLNSARIINKYSTILYVIMYNQFTTVYNVLFLKSLVEQFKYI